jgi:nicotinamide-nucleotide amidase
LKPSTQSDAAVELKTLLLQDPRWTLAVAESLTAGNVQARIGMISGASHFFRGGITAYSLEQKVRHLGVDAVLAGRVNSVSEEIAEQMARGACRMFDADFGVGTTGYAEPSPENGAMHPYAWWAVVKREQRGQFSGVRGRVECPGKSRVQTQAMVADAVLAELVEWVRKCRG